MREPGSVVPAESPTGAQFAAAWLAAKEKALQPVSYGEQMPLYEIVQLALSRGVVFESATQVFLLGLCERLSGQDQATVPVAASRLTGELHAIGRILTDMVDGGGEVANDAALAAQVWRIEVIAAHERQLAAISHQAAARATIMRRHGLHYFEDADLEALAQAMSRARDIGEFGNQISRAAWRALARGVIACFWITREERVFMLDQMATYLLEDAGIVIARDARTIIQAVANGETEPVAA